MKIKYKLAIMRMATEFAKTSEANRLKVGSILYKNDNIISMGVNGTVSGWHTNQCEGEDGNTTPAVRHSEINCLNKLRRSSETAIGATLFVTHQPCLACAMELVEAGIVKVIYTQEYRLSDGVKYLQDMGIEVENIKLIQYMA
jgi:dCMP deaminase